MKNVSVFQERLLNQKKPEKKWCTRSWKSCCLITLFYFGFYSVLVGFWALCFYVFYEKFITLDRPAFVLEDSRIAGFGSEGIKPGISILPQLPLEFDHDFGRHYNWYMDENWSQMFNHTTKNHIWAEKIAQVFPNQTSSNVTECQENDHSFKQREVCKFPLSELGNICQAYPFGYMRDPIVIKPCLYLKLNRVLHFTPEPYDHQGDNFKSTRTV